MKNSKFLFLSFLFVGFIFYSFVPNRQQTNDLKYELGFSINPSAGTGTVSYVVLGIDKNGVIVSKKLLTEGQFVMIGKGLLRSKANPERIDLYKKYMIDCGIILDYPKMMHGVLVEDTMWNEMKPVCLPIYDIWKLRYSHHPKYGQGKFMSKSGIPPEDLGWSANGARPSHAQTLFLKKYYGISTIQDFFHGEKMFLLFRDMQNSDWVIRYSEMS